MYKNFFNKTFEYQEKDSHIAILGDSIEVMKSMKSNSIDLIFADEPYNLGKNFGKGTDRWNSVEEYLEWNYLWIEEAMRILKKDGTMYLMTATQYMPYIDIFVQKKYHVLSRIVWAYDSSGVQSKKNFGSLYEPILMITHTSKSKYTFNYEDILVETKTGAKRGLIDYRKTPPQPYNTKKVPGNVWQYSRVRFKMEEYENHPTQKPEALLERIIKASSNKGDVVFDPFGGSFTTGVVAKKLMRKSISIDIEPEFFKIGLRRLEITNLYKNELLIKEKKRKTKNKSKKDHILT
ncbi:TPA: adenine-specific DNA-methyltransferase [Enterococcus faecalis]